MIKVIIFLWHFSIFQVTWGLTQWNFDPMFTLYYCRNPNELYMPNKFQSLQRQDEYKKNQAIQQPSSLHFSFPPPCPKLNRSYISLNLQLMYLSVLSFWYGKWLNSSTSSNIPYNLYQLLLLKWCHRFLTLRICLGNSNSRACSNMILFHFQFSIKPSRISGSARLWILCLSIHILVTLSLLYQAYIWQPHLYPQPLFKQSTHQMHSLLRILSL